MGTPKKRKPTIRANEEKRTQIAIESLLTRSGLVVNRVNSGAFTGGTGVRVKCNSILGKSDLEVWFELKPTDETKMSIGLCLYMEIKSSIGKQNPNQKNFQKLMERSSQRYVVVRTLEESVSEVLKWKSEIEKDYPSMTLDVGKLSRYKFKGK